MSHPPHQPPRHPPPRAPDPSALPEGDGPLPATYVVDTNVILVANGQHPAVSEACQQRCVHWLRQIMAQGRIALYAGFEILREYQHKTHAAGGALAAHGSSQSGQQERVGDAFVAWALHHVDDAARCDLVTLEADAALGWRGFPDDQRLAHFDPSDRKFVVVAALHPEHPPILQAADCKWLDWQGALAEHGVVVTMLCAPEMHQFHLHKFGV